MLTRLLHLLYEFIIEDLRPCVRELRAYLRERQTVQSGPPAEEEPAAAPETGGIYCVTQEGIEAGRWISCKEAWIKLGIVKTTLVERLNAGVLHRFHKKGDEYLRQPRVWLSKEEVTQYFNDYTLRKGKEK